MFVLQQTNNLSDTNIFDKYRSGFKSNHSADLFLSSINDKILKDFCNVLYTGMILMGLQGAFDMINHKILLNKLLSIDFSKNTISWYESYLADPSFTAEIGN